MRQPNEETVNRSFTIQGGEHNSGAYSDHAENITPSFTRYRRVGGMSGSLPGSNEPYLNLLNCIHAIGKYFPRTYHVQGAGDSAVTKTLSHAAHMLSRKAEINNKKHKAFLFCFVFYQLYRTL